MIVWFLFGSLLFFLNSLRGAPIEDLCLAFTLPGFPDYVLKEGEQNTIVNIHNLEEYVSLVVDATVKSGIMKQVEAFISGFSQVFDISSLQIFSPQELDYLICGRQEIWEAKSLVDNIKFDHRFTPKSPAIINLLEIMAEFTPDQQHAFCQFVTGASRLPTGGLAALSPRLTIVRKHPSSGVSALNTSGVTDAADDDLPSVMTCANYLKLPPYSTKEVMRKKLLYAILEGRGSFDLSWADKLTIQGSPLDARQFYPEIVFFFVACNNIGWGYQPLRIKLERSVEPAEAASLASTTDKYQEHLSSNTL